MNIHKSKEISISCSRNKQHLTEMIPESISHTLPKMVILSVIVCEIWQKLCVLHKPLLISYFVWTPCNKYGKKCILVKNKIWVSGHHYMMLRKGYHCGFVMSCDVLNLSQHLHRQWLFAWRHQANTGTITTADLSYVMFCCIYFRKISQLLQLLRHPTGARESMRHDEMYWHRRLSNTLLTSSNASTEHANTKSSEQRSPGNTRTI